MVVKQFTVDRPEPHSFPDTVPSHRYNPFYLRLDLKTRSTRLLHNAIQQTSVDATPEHHAAVVSDLAAAGVLQQSDAASAQLPLPHDLRSSSIVSATGKKTVVFADTVYVCADDDSDTSDSDGVRAPSKPAVTNYVFDVHSQTGEVVGDVLIERRRDPPQPSATPSPVDEDPASGRLERHRMFCRLRQSPVYSCDDGHGDGGAVVDPAAADSASLSSVYESCEDLPAVVLHVEAGGRPPLRRSAAALNGYATSCCPS